MPKTSEMVKSGSRRTTHLVLSLHHFIHQRCSYLKVIPTDAKYQVKDAVPKRAEISAVCALVIRLRVCVRRELFSLTFRSALPQR